MAKKVAAHSLGSDGPAAPSQTTPLGDLYHYLITASFLVANLAFATAYYFGGGVQHAQPGSFSDVFFFSIQTMATIGYGDMAPVTNLSNVLVSLEAFLGLLGLAMVTGLVFAKFSRPTARIRFSNNAIVAPRDGIPSLMFRMANLRGNRIVDAQVQVVLSREEKTLEGEEVRRFHDLATTRGRNALFAFSWTAIHPITESSPLFGESRDSLEQAASMIVVSLMGLDETLSQTVHARHLYLPADIVWGGRFADIIMKGTDGSRTVDYSRFDEIVSPNSAVLDSK